MLGYSVGRHCCCVIFQLCTELLWDLNCQLQNSKHSFHPEKPARSSLTHILPHPSWSCIGGSRTGNPCSRTLKDLRL